MGLSQPADHIFMVEKGFGHEELNAMEEGEFLFLLKTRIDFDKARAEAEKEAAKKS